MQFPMPTPNMDPMGFLNQMMQQNPQMQNNPNMQKVQGFVQNGDFNGLQQFGQNLCNSHGVTPQQVLQQMGFGNIPFK